MKTILFSSLALFVVTAGAAFADESNEAASNTANPEALYAAACQPGSELEKTWDAAQRKETLKFRKDFTAFLKNPLPTVKKLEAAQKDASLDLGNQIGLLFHYAFTCGFVSIIEQQLLTQGCKDSNGKAIAHLDNVIRLCAPITEKVKEQQQEAAPQDSPSEQ
jgi:hypothetical protein